jgi:hypothetical protein
LLCGPPTNPKSMDAIWNKKKIAQLQEVLDIARFL